jgi:pimeloyl-ACP methyl ester carboxylesterase
VGEPTVVFEAGLAATSLSWTYVQPEVAKFARTFAYDRAGLGWSESGRAPRTVGVMVEALKTVLVRAELNGPFVLVGHSFGGLVVRAFAAAYPNDVAGLVLVDPVSLEYWAACSEGERRRVARGTKLSRRGAWLARVGVVRFALTALAAGARTMPKLIARTTAGRATGFAERLAGEIRKLPPEVLPMVRAHWCEPKSFVAMAETLERLPENARTALGMKIPAAIPLTVLSAASATAEELVERDEWVRESRCGEHIRLRECGHWLPLERPGEIVAAIRAMAAGVGPKIEKCGNE